MAISVIYRTTDGKEFKTEGEALEHESVMKKLKNEVKEDLSRILIKLQNLKSATVTSDDDGYYEIKDKESLEDVWLCSLKTILTDMTRSDYTMESYLTQYYDSSCY